MLTLTDNASAIVTSLVARQSKTAEAGLRIHSTSDESTDSAARLAVHVVVDPEPQDQVIEISGARLFLDEVAVTALDDKILDAGVDDQGAVSFAVLPQSA